MVMLADRSVDVERAIRAVLDPEIPVITLDDLGVIRSLEVDGDVVRVVMTPTYSGCPAMEAMERSVRVAIAAQGFRPEVSIRLEPAWTTDWMSAAGRERLREFGIAPPGTTGGAGPRAITLRMRQVSCPVCGSPETEVLSQFGSTACKALRRCTQCREPFEEFKAL
ncbi:1,2-phenylacetyl-CoA epoxidase subunit PaaD [Calidifontibacter terrae]